MIRESLYHKTVGILVDAYFNDTLEHGNCTKCAVGNLINARKSFTKKEQTELEFHDEGWVKVFCTLNGISQTINHEQYKGKAKEQIDLTGYSYSELAKIEFAFESATPSKNEDEFMFNGLMAVIEVLDIIHQNTDEQLTKSSKQKFVKCS